MPKNAENLVFLKYNLRALGYNSIKMTMPENRPVREIDDSSDDEPDILAEEETSD